MAQFREVVNVLATEFSVPILIQRRSGALNAATRQSWPRYISTGDFDWEHPLHTGRGNPPRGGVCRGQRAPKRQLIDFYQMVSEILSRRHSHGFRAELSRDLAILSSSGYEKRGLKLKIIGLITPSASKRYGTTTG
jgi:hypothetical protein